MTQVLLSILMAAFPACEVEDGDYCTWSHDNGVIVNLADDTHLDFWAR